METLERQLKAFSSQEAVGPDLPIICMKDLYSYLTNCLSLVYSFTVKSFLPPANEVCEGYVFTPVSQSFCSQGGACVVVGGGVRGCREACMVAGDVHGCGGHAWLWGVCMVVGGVHGCWGACVVVGGMCGCRGVCMVVGGHAWDMTRYGQ